MLDDDTMLDESPGAAEADEVEGPGTTVLELWPRDTTDDDDITGSGSPLEALEADPASL